MARKTKSGKELSFNKTTKRWCKNYQDAEGRRKTKYFGSGTSERDRRSYEEALKAYHPWQQERETTRKRLELHATHQADQHQIMATASHMSYISPPPFAAQYAAVEVDTETGQVTAQQVVMAVVCGVAINPATASGQVEGGMVQALGYALCEEMPYDGEGRLAIDRLGEYRIFAADEVPELGVILVQTYEPSGPYGAKAVAEIPMDGMAPALASAIYDATGVRLRQIPFTPERVWRGVGRRDDRMKG